MIGSQMKNEKGFTLIEMMIAAAMSVVLLGAAVYTYTKQDKLLREENRNLQTRDFTRLAIDHMIDDLLIAGYGFPPGNSNIVGQPARGITNADATTITYRANTDNVSTNSAWDAFTGSNGFLMPLGTADTGVAATSFAAGDNVVFFNADNPADWGNKVISAAGVTTATIGTVDYDKIVWASGTNDVELTAISDNFAVSINKYHTITYAFDSGNQQITRSIDGATAVPVVNKVSNLTFSYFDQTGAPLTALPYNDADGDLGVNIRRIGISITAVNDDDSNITATLSTDINLRNMGK